jgi:hypothetical protein
MSSSGSNSNTNQPTSPTPKRKRGFFKSVINAVVGGNRLAQNGQNGGAQSGGQNGAQNAAATKYVVAAEPARAVAEEAAAPTENDNAESPPTSLATLATTLTPRRALSGEKQRILKLLQKKQKRVEREEEAKKQMEAATPETETPRETALRKQLKEVEKKLKAAEENAKRLEDAAKQKDFEERARKSYLEKEVLRKTVEKIGTKIGEKISEKSAELLGNAAKEKEIEERARKNYLEKEVFRKASEKIGTKIAEKIGEKSAELLDLENAATEKDFEERARKNYLEKEVARITREKMGTEVGEEISEEKSADLLEARLHEDFADKLGDQLGEKLALSIGNKIGEQIGQKLAGSIAEQIEKNIDYVDSAARSPASQASLREAEIEEEERAQSKKLLKMAKVQRKLQKVEKLKKKLREKKKLEEMERIEVEKASAIVSGNEVQSITLSSGEECREARTGRRVSEDVIGEMINDEVEDVGERAENVELSEKAVESVEGKVVRRIESQNIVGTVELGVSDRLENNIVELGGDIVVAVGNRDLEKFNREKRKEQKREQKRKKTRSGEFSSDYSDDSDDPSSGIYPSSPHSAYSVFSDDEKKQTPKVEQPSETESGSSAYASEFVSESTSESQNPSDQAEKDNQSPPIIVPPSGGKTDVPNARLIPGLTIPTVEKFFPFETPSLRSPSRFSPPPERKMSEKLRKSLSPERILTGEKENTDAALSALSPSVKHCANVNALPLVPEYKLSESLEAFQARLDNFVREPPFYSERLKAEVFRMTDKEKRERFCVSGASPGGGGGSGVGGISPGGVSPVTTIPRGGESGDAVIGATGIHGGDSKSGKPLKCVASNVQYGVFSSVRPNLAFTKGIGSPTYSGAHFASPTTMTSRSPGVRTGVQEVVGNSNQRATGNSGSGSSSSSNTRHPIDMAQPENIHSTDIEDPAHFQTAAMQGRIMQAGILGGGEHLPGRNHGTVVGMMAQQDSLEMSVMQRHGRASANGKSEGRKLS